MLYVPLPVPYVFGAVSTLCDIVYSLRDIILYTRIRLILPPIQASESSELEQCPKNDSPIKQVSRASEENKNFTSCLPVCCFLFSHYFDLEEFRYNSILIKKKKRLVTSLRNRTKKKRKLPVFPFNLVHDTDTEVL